MTHGATTFEAGSHGGGKSQPTKHFAGAERVSPYEEDPFLETGDTTRADNSKEYILPKLPTHGVHVRKDVRVDFS